MHGTLRTARLATLPLLLGLLVLAGCTGKPSEAPPSAPAPVPRAEATATAPAAEGETVTFPSTTPGTKAPSSAPGDTAAAPTDGPDTSARPTSQDAAPPAVDRTRAERELRGFTVVYISYDAKTDLPSRTSALAAMVSPTALEAIRAGTAGMSDSDIKEAIADGRYARNVKVTGIACTGNADDKASFVVSYSYDTIETEGADLGPVRVEGTFTAYMNRKYAITAIY